MLALRATWNFLLFTTISQSPMACTRDRAAFAFSVCSRCCPAMLHLDWGVSEVLEHTVSDSVSALVLRKASSCARQNDRRALSVICPAR